MSNQYMINNFVLFSKACPVKSQSFSSLEKKKKVWREMHLVK